MKEIKASTVKLRSIKIENYKGIDSLTIDFPIPMLLGDPDILVMGSENGLGKTSVIECCTLILICLSIAESSFKLDSKFFSIDIPDLFIRAGANATEIIGDISIEKKNFLIKLNIDRSGLVTIDKPKSLELNCNYIDVNQDLNGMVKSICGFSPNPVIGSMFLFFHSYRKVQEGNPELGMMISNSKASSSNGHAEMSLSEFKLIILRALMYKANLFEFSEEKKPEEIISKLNELITFYAGGTISKLRPSSDNTVDFRITSTDGSDSLTFDGLSSGQKEIISTLFLIWYHTRNRPIVVFVDEPELHLNAQWHRSFINKLMELAPNNQYIIATHSEDIMDSVSEDQRILLYKRKDIG